MHDHALGEQTLERLLHVDMAGLSHGARKEARIEEMEDRMLDAADILIDGEPVIGRLRVGRIILPGRGEAYEIPAGINERIHGVRLAARIGTALRARDM